MDLHWCLHGSNLAHFATNLLEGVRQASVELDDVAHRQWRLPEQQVRRKDGRQDEELQGQGSGSVTWQSSRRLCLKVACSQSLETADSVLVE